MFCDAAEFENAHAYMTQAEQHTLNNKHHLGCAMKGRASIWYRQGRLEDAVSEVMCAIEIFEKLGAARNLDKCRDLLRDIESAKPIPSAHQSPSSTSVDTLATPGELLDT